MTIIADQPQKTPPATTPGEPAKRPLLRRFRKDKTPPTTVAPAVVKAAPEADGDGFPPEPGTPAHDYLMSCLRGRPLSGAQLGALHGRGDRWGREQIAAITSGLDEDASAAETRAYVDALIGAAERAEAEHSASGATVLAWLAMGIGITASVAANILHTLVATPDAQLPQIIGAAWWPIALLVMTEVLTRTAWTRRRQDGKLVATAAAWVARLGGVAVAAVAAVVSYRHMYGLLHHWGEDPLSTIIGPVGVDGLVLVGAMALLVQGRKKAKR